MARYLSGSLVVDGATLQGGQSGTIAVTSQIPSTSSFATRSWVQSQGYLTSSSLSGYATRSWSLDSIVVLAPTTYLTDGAWMVNGSGSPSGDTFPSGKYGGVRYCDDAGGNSWGGYFSVTAGGSISLGTEGGFFIAKRMD